MWPESSSVNSRNMAKNYDFGDMKFLMVCPAV